VRIRREEEGPGPFIPPKGVNLWAKFSLNFYQYVLESRDWPIPPQNPIQQNPDSGGPSPTKKTRVAHDPSAQQSDYDMTTLLPSSSTSAAVMPVPSHLELSPTVPTIEDLGNYDLFIPCQK
jgi:hypothetical protein